MAQNTLLLRLIEMVAKDERIKLKTGDVVAEFDSDIAAANTTGRGDKHAFRVDYQNGRCLIKMNPHFAGGFTIPDLKRVIAHELVHSQHPFWTSKTPLNAKVQEEGEADLAAARTYGAQAEIDLLDKLGAQSPANYIADPKSPNPDIRRRGKLIMDHFHGTEIVHPEPSAVSTPSRLTASPSATGPAPRPAHILPASSLNMK